MGMSTQFFNKQQFNDYLFPGMSLRLGADAPDLEIFRDSIRAQAFSGSGAVVEQGFFSLHILHDIKQGTAPTFHVHWGHKIGAPSGNVKWQIAYTKANGYGDGTFGVETVLSTVQAAPAQYVHELTDDDDMALPTDLEPDSVLLCRVFRDPADGADTFEDDAFLFFVDLHYERGQTGTDERNRPFASANFP